MRSDLHECFLEQYLASWQTRGNTFRQANLDQTKWFGRECECQLVFRDGPAVWPISGSEPVTGLPNDLSLVLKIFKSRLSGSRETRPGRGELLQSLGVILLGIHRARLHYRLGVSYSSGRTEGAFGTATGCDTPRGVLCTPTSPPLHVVLLRVHGARRLFHQCRYPPTTSCREERAGGGSAGTGGAENSVRCPESDRPLAWVGSAV